MLRIRNRKNLKSIEMRIAGIIHLLPSFFIPSDIRDGRTCEWCIGRGALVTETAPSYWRTLIAPEGPIGDPPGTCSEILWTPSYQPWTFVCAQKILSLDLTIPNQVQEILREESMGTVAWLVNITRNPPAMPFRFPSCKGLYWSFASCRAGPIKSVNGVS